MSAQRCRGGTYTYGAGRSSRSRSAGSKAKNKNRSTVFRLARDSGYRFYRGMTWNHGAKFSRMVDEAGASPHWGIETVGFRLVRDEEGA